MIQGVHHPEHYGGDTPYEVLKVMEAWDPIATYYFARFNSVKYLARAGKKAGVSAEMDLAKSAFYAERALQVYSRLPDELLEWLEARPL